MNLLLLLFLSILTVGGVSSCSYDDSSLWTEVNNIKKELKGLNTEINSLQGIVEALQKGKLITRVEELRDEGGYTISFGDGTAITLKHGKDAPVVGIKPVDGIYYWTLKTGATEDFLTDADGEKIRVSGEDGHSPAIAVNADGYWTLDGELIHNAAGEAVKAVGQDGDAFFRSVEEGEESVLFTLTNGTTLTLPKKIDFLLRFVDTEESKKAGYYLADDRQVLRIDFVAEGIKDLVVSDHPDRWTVELDKSEKQLQVTLPNLSSGTFYIGGLIQLEGVDKSGRLYRATADVRKVGVDYLDPSGTFVVCEGNMSDSNGKVYFYSKDLTQYEGIFQAANGGLEIGNVVQDMYIANGRAYFLTQNGNSQGGAGRFVVCDARTMKMIYAHPLSFESPKGVACWPQHLVVTETDKVFVQYSSSDMEQTSGMVEVVLKKDGTVDRVEYVEGTFGDFTKSGTGKLRFVYSRGKIYAGNGASVVIVDPESRKVIKKIEHEGEQVKGIVKAADGNIYYALSGKFDPATMQFGTKFSTRPRIIGINHEGNQISAVECPKPIEFPTATWSPTIQMAASFNEPYLYFTDTQDFAVLSATRYNYETKHFDPKYIKFEDSYSIYGYMGVNPETKQIWVTRSTNFYTTGDTYVFDDVAGKATLKRNFHYNTRSGASPAGVDFAYRFSTEWIGK